MRIDRRVHPGDSASNPAGIRNANGAAIKSATYDNVNACKRATQLQRSLGFSCPIVRSIRRSSALSAALLLRGASRSMDCSDIERPVVSKMTSFDRSDVTFTTGAKNLKLARQAWAYWEMIPTDTPLSVFHSN
jgi:hypothetical protein